MGLYMSGIYIPGIEMPKEASVIVKICRDGDVCGIRGGIIAKAIPAADVRPVPETEIGDMSDGHHDRCLEIIKCTEGNKSFVKEGRACFADCPYIAEEGADEE